MNSIIVFLVFFATVSIVRGFSHLSPSILKSLEEKGNINIIVSFKGNSVGRLLSDINSRQFKTRADKITNIYETLRSHADVTQAKVWDTLSKYRGLASTQLWITNQIIIQGADKSLIEGLIEGFEEISGIEGEEYFELPKLRTAGNLTTAEGPSAEIPWGLEEIQVPKVWEEGTKGQGIVIASIDSGVRRTHEALETGFRELHGWFDPIHRTGEPTDTHGHGTHTMGTILGSVNTIGVAPEAQWIACRACPEGGCTTTELLLCGQWVMCPTDTEGNNGRCDLAPRIVSNSWGFGRKQFFHNVVDVWVAGGIIPVVSTGNYGDSGCGSIISPADHSSVISVGSINANNQVSSFSGRGPAPITEATRPDISAPGMEIYSSNYESDSSYVHMDGTSMAAPHVTGVVALLLSKRPELSLEQVKLLLQLGAQGVEPLGETCGERSDQFYPNNQVGQGKVNAKVSYDTLLVLFP